MLNGPMAEFRNRHASNLELFIDLVFVFSVTQITSFVASHLSWAGVAKGVLLAFLVWWQWTGFTWAGTAIDFQSNSKARVLVLCMVPAMLVMAISVPRALDGQGRWFGSAYMVVQLFVLGLQALEARRSKITLAPFLRYAPLAAVAPTVLFVSSFFDGDARVVGFALAALGMIGSAIAATDRGGEWKIDPTHFTERHALFVIITLGEVLVAIGATAAEATSEAGLDLGTLAAITATAAVAGVLWWAYFGFVPVVIEAILDRTDATERGGVARDVGSFGHFPLVVGLILYAVVAKHVVRHPGDHLAGADRAVLLGSMLLFTGAQMAIQYRLRRAVAPERVVALGAFVVLAVLAGVLPGTAIIALLAAVLIVVATITDRRFRRSEFARALALDL